MKTKLVIIIFSLLISISAFAEGMELSVNGDLATEPEGQTFILDKELDEGDYLFTITRDYHNFNILTISSKCIHFEIKDDSFNGFKMGIYCPDEEED